jgi:hypothetical protein
MELGVRVKSVQSPRFKIEIAIGIAIGIGDDTLHSDPTYSSDRSDATRNQKCEAVQRISPVFLFDPGLPGAP